MPNSHITTVQAAGVLFNYCYIRHISRITQFSYTRKLSSVSRSIPNIFVLVILMNYTFYCKRMHHLTPHMILGIVDCGLRNPVAAKFINKDKDISPRFSKPSPTCIDASIRQNFHTSTFLIQNDLFNLLSNSLKEFELQYIKQIWCCICLMNFI